MALTALPFAALVTHFVAHRLDPVMTVVLTTPGTTVVAATLGCIGLVKRRYALDLLDRRFFRESYDARMILSNLIDQCRSVGNVDDLAGLLRQNIEAALHAIRVDLFVHDQTVGRFVSFDGAIRPVDATTPLVAAIASSDHPLDVDPRNAGSALFRLPAEDQEWVLDSRSQLLVPILSSDGKPLGFMSLGEKKSELPFSKEDRTLLRNIASSTSLAMESHQWLSKSIESLEGPASECLVCSRMYPSCLTVCSHCHWPSQPAAVPYVLLGKFRFQRRLGSGGSGVVYRAFDLHLGTDVAIKTLPKRSPQEAIRLRSEARLIASVKHANLVEIKGFETWRGIPMLVFEYLDGGTLADRLRKHPLSIRETLETGIILCNVLEYIHDQRICHLDIKPSNLGYSGGTLKLLDFGVARIAQPHPTEATRLSTESIARMDSEPTMLEGSIEQQPIVGTCAYWPREILTGAAQTETFDLWAAGLVLYESLTGCNPMIRSSVEETLNALKSTTIPDIRELLPGCPASLADFFSGALSPTASHRPPTAKAMRLRLQELATQAL
jgi:hypothetical protein